MWNIANIAYIVPDETSSTFLVRENSAEYLIFDILLKIKVDL